MPSPDHGLAERRAVDRRVGPDLDVVLETDDPDLRNLSVSRRRPRRSRTRPNRRPRPRAGRSGRRSGSRRTPPRSRGAGRPRRSRRPPRRRPRARSPCARRCGRAARRWRPPRPRLPGPRRAVRSTRAPGRTPGRGRGSGRKHLEPGGEGGDGFRNDDGGAPLRRRGRRGEVRPGPALSGRGRVANVRDEREVLGTGLLQTPHARQAQRRSRRRTLPPTARATSASVKSAARLPRSEALPARGLLPDRFHRAGYYPQPADVRKWKGPPVGGPVTLSTNAESQFGFFGVGLARRGVRIGRRLGRRRSARRRGAEAGTATVVLKRFSTSSVTSTPSSA